MESHTSNEIPLYRSEVIVVIVIGIVIIVTIPHRNDHRAPPRFVSFILYLTHSKRQWYATEQPTIRDTDS